MKLLSILSASFLAYNLNFLQDCPSVSVLIIYLLIYLCVFRLVYPTINKLKVKRMNLLAKYKYQKHQIKRNQVT